MEHRVPTRQARSTTHHGIEPPAYPVMNHPGFVPRAAHDPPHHRPAALIAMIVQTTQPTGPHARAQANLRDTCSRHLVDTDRPAGADTARSRRRRRKAGYSTMWNRGVGRFRTDPPDGAPADAEIEPQSASACGSDRTIPNLLVLEYASARIDVQRVRSFRSPSRNPAGLCCRGRVSRLLRCLRNDKPERFRSNRRKGTDRVRSRVHGCLAVLTCVDNTAKRIIIDAAID